MRALISAAQRPDYPATIVLVLANRPTAQGLVFARECNIATAVIDHTIYRQRADFERAMQMMLALHRVELICLAGFMRILSEGFVRAWHGRMVNIHPALLPAYKGLHTHERALHDGVRVHGCTAHFVISDIDSGPIIAQAAVPVCDGDTPASLAARVIAQEHIIYPLALDLVASGRVEIAGNRAKILAPLREPAALIVPSLADTTVAAARSSPS